MCATICLEGANLPYNLQASQIVDTARPGLNGHASRTCAAMTTLFDSVLRSYRERSVDDSQAVGTNRPLSAIMDCPAAPQPRS